MIVRRLPIALIVLAVTGCVEADFLTVGTKVDALPDSLWTASYRSAAGLIKSSWRYEGDTWTWTFTIPEGATATVCLPGGDGPEDYAAGTYTVRR